MKFEVTQEVLALFPNLVIGVVQGQIELQRPNIKESIVGMRDAALKLLQSKVATKAELGNHPHVIAWRDAYQRFGVKAKKYPPTHEAFAGRLLNGGSWPNINDIVDIYLVNQLAHLVPHGGYDFGCLSGDMKLDLSVGNEVFEPLGAGIETPAPGEVIYKDEQRVLTRRWNYRDCDITKIMDTTVQFVLMIESPNEGISENAIEAASQDLVDRYSKCFQGTFRYQILKPTSQCNVFGL